MEDEIIVQSQCDIIATAYRLFQGCEELLTKGKAAALILVAQTVASNLTALLDILPDA